MINIEVIETNLIIDENNVIRDHQSRVVEADSWDVYCKAYEEYNGKAIFFESKYMKGYSVMSNQQVLDLKYDKIHLSCMVIHPNGSTTKHLAYKGSF